MTWNYRLIHMDVTVPDSNWFQVAEVYYDDAGNITMWTPESLNFDSDFAEDVAASLKQAAEDLAKYPILLESELPRC